MSKFKETIPPAYFDDLYATDADPWRFATSAYERDKYEKTIAALPRSEYDRVLEVGCSIGVLTERLASRCQILISVDVSETALEAARKHCAHLQKVSFQRAAVPSDWPDGDFDLILLSEVVYYLDIHDVDRLVDRVLSSIKPGGEVLLVHWLGETHYPLTGDEASDHFIARLGDRMKITKQSRRTQYRLDLLTAPI
jgi:cyclopropane fatty-acyl-phospholipid synthase-like methyltransferase